VKLLAPLHWLVFALGALVVGYLLLFVMPLTVTALLVIIALLVAILLRLGRR
jgi:hypothetical protein